MNRSPRLMVLGLVAAILVTACGSDDEPVAAPADEQAADEQPAAEPSTAGEPAPTGDGASATIAPDVPEEFLPAIGPVEVLGDVLPFLDTADVATDPAVGMPAPVLIGEAYDGSTVRIDATASGPTMVVFLAHWCPHCNDEIPRINSLRDEARFPDDLNIVAVATASSPQRPNFPPGPWLDDMDWTYSAMADGIDTVRETFIAAEAFGVSGFPFVTLIDGNGDVAARWSGETDPDQFITRIDQYLGLG